MLTMRNRVRNKKGEILNRRFKNVIGAVELLLFAMIIAYIMNKN